MSGPRASTPFPITEWRLQQALAGIWAAQGVTVGGERLYLAAWEVMTDWRINDAALQSTAPRSTSSASTRGAASSS